MMIKKILMIAYVLFIPSHIMASHYTHFVASKNLLTTGSELMKVVSKYSLTSPKPSIYNYSKLFTASNVNVKVKRIEQAYKEIPSGMKGIPISNDPDFPLYCRYRSDKTFLPKLYAALSNLTGPSDDDFDSYKGSFSFNFMLDVEKDTRKSRFLYWMMQYRSFMRVKLYEIVPESDPRDERYYAKTNNLLFSEEDIIGFSFAFTLDLLKEFEMKKVTPDPFVLSSYSDAKIFGYLDNEYFFKEFDEHDVFKEKLKKLEDALKKVSTPETEKSTELKEEAPQDQDTLTAKKRKTDTE